MEQKTIYLVGVDTGKNEIVAISTELQFRLTIKLEGEGYEILPPDTEKINAILKTYPDLKGFSDRGELKSKEVLVVLAVNQEKALEIFIEHLRVEKPTVWEMVEQYTTIRIYSQTRERDAFSYGDKVYTPMSVALEGDGEGEGRVCNVPLRLSADNLKGLKRAMIVGNYTRQAI